MKEFTSLGSLGSLIPKGNPTVQCIPNGYENEGESCTTHDGRRGKLIRAKTGGLICQFEESSMNQQNVNESVALRFSSASRMQIGKQHMDFDVHMRAVQGTGNLSISPIRGAPGTWYFDVSSPSANNQIDPKQFLHHRMVSGVQ